MEETLIDTAFIADRLGYGREYVTDRVVKREDFPAPALSLNRKRVKWRLSDFEAWLEAQAIRAAGRSGKRAPRPTISR
jgi:predicted DNA-binding transcriptional regulator AlpA